MKISIIKKGMRLRVKTYPPGKRPGTWNQSGKMDHWMGQVVTVKDIDPDIYSGDGISIVEDQEENSGMGWAWRASNFELVEHQQKLWENL